MKKQHRRVSRDSHASGRRAWYIINLEVKFPMPWLARWFAVYVPSVYPTRSMLRGRLPPYNRWSTVTFPFSFDLISLVSFPKSVTLFAVMPPINTGSTRSPGIKALCSQLGYNEAKESPRHFTCLATPLRQFRSLNKAYDVARYALEFCERNKKDKHFLTSSREARRNGWPVLPDDKDRYCTPPCPDIIIPLIMAIVLSK